MAQVVAELLLGGPRQRHLHVVGLGQHVGVERRQAPRLLLGDPPHKGVLVKDLLVVVGVDPGEHGARRVLAVDVVPVDHGLLVCEVRARVLGVDEDEPSQGVVAVGARTQVGVVGLSLVHREVHRRARNLHPGTDVGVLGLEGRPVHLGRGVGGTRLHVGLGLGHLVGHGLLLAHAVEPEPQGGADEHDVEHQQQAEEHLAPQSPLSPGLLGHGRLPRRAWTRRRPPRPACRSCPGSRG